MGLLGAILGGVVGFLVGGPVGAAIGAGVGATKVGEKVINTVMDFVLQPFMPKIDAPSAEDAASREQGVLIQRQGSTHTIPIVYGYRKVGGIVTFAETGSSNNKYLYVAYVFSEGLVEGLREVFIDDWQLPTDQIGALNAGQVVTVNADRYKDIVQLQWFPGVGWPDFRRGSAEDRVGAKVKSGIFAEAPSFTTNMDYNGLAVIFARYEWKEQTSQTASQSNPFSGSIPQLQIGVLGKRVASLLVDTTETTEYDNNEIRYSTNPAECLLDYLRNPRYGKGLKNEDIDWTTWKKAARKCNQTVTYVASGIQGPILTLNIVVDTAQTLMSNTKTMLQNFRAYMPYVQGKYKLRIEDAGNPDDILSGQAYIVQTFTKDDIVSDVTYSGIDRSSKYNVVTVTYIDPDQKWDPQTVVYPEAESERQVYIDADGGRENKYDVTLGGITNYAIAKDMARLIFNKQRRQESCVFTATSKALELEPGDIIAIQSNILNFSNDPWRVVSIKVNNDMTVDLGCVRNPDDIYPYVRVGEQDLIFPTYIPKGSIIYFPSSDNRIPLGLVPPVNAVYLSNTAPSASNPLPTNPNGTTGGGVGGGSPTGQTTAGPITATPTTPTSSANNSAGNTATPTYFSAQIVLKSVTATPLGNNTYDFNITFTQPNDALYNKMIFWWRLNSKSNWIPIETAAKPGSGGEISVRVSGLPPSTYEFYARAYATDGRASTWIAKGTFQTRQDQTTGAIVGSGGSIPQQVTEGWSVPAGDVSSTPKYDDNIDYFAIQPVVGSNPRRLSVKIQQLTNVLTSVLNTNINGFVVYYRYKGDTYWSKEQFSYPANYSNLGQLTFTLAGDFGVAGTLGELQKYEFFVRLTYKDGTSAQKQLGPVIGLVEQSQTGLTTFDVVGTSPYASGVVSSQPIPTGFTFLTTDQDPNKANPVAAELTASLQVQYNIINKKLNFLFSGITNSKWRGFKIRYREVTPGSNPAFTTVDILAFTNTYNQQTVTLESPKWYPNKKYEYVITAKYYDVLTSTTKDCTNSYYGQFYLPDNDYNFYNIDLFNKIFTGTQPILTTKALGNLATSFASLPTINAKSWVKKTNIPAGGVKKTADPQGAFRANTYSGNTGTLAAYPDVYDADAGNNYLNAWYQLKFQPDSASDNIVIYRRVYDAYGLQRTTTAGGQAKYTGLGPWERVSVSLSSLSADSEGWKILNVRGPIGSTVFNGYYEINAGNDLFGKPYGPGAPTYTNSGKFPGGITQTNPSNIANIYPYYGVGNGLVSSTRTRYAEFIFVLATGSTEKTQGLRLVEFYSDTSGTNFKTEVDGAAAGVSLTDVVTLSDLNGLSSGYKRNLNEALTGLTFNNLAAGSIAYGREGVPNYPWQTPSSGYIYFLQQPTTGETVY